MKELESITAETLVDSKELNQLIARLSNPTHGRSNGGVSVKDIAETMDLNEDKVIQELVRMRKQKETQPVPQQAEKLVAALDELKSTDFRPVSNRPLKRVPATLVILICALLFGENASSGYHEKKLISCHLPLVTILDFTNPHLRLKSSAQSSAGFVVSNAHKAASFSISRN